MVGRGAPLRALGRLRTDGLDVDVLDLPTATHAFDDDHASDSRTVYDPALARQAEHFFVEALRGALTPGGSAETP